MQTIILTNPYSRDTAKSLIDRAPSGYVVKVGEPKRTNSQNDKMWSMLGDISRAKPVVNGEAIVHTPEDWKCILMNACNFETMFLNGLDGRPFPAGFRSSQMTKSQMSALIEYMNWFGAEHGVRWTKE